MRPIVLGLLVAAALAGRAYAQSTPVPPSGTPAAPAGSPAAAPSPIIPPRDASPVRSTTPPLPPKADHSTPNPPDNVWFGSASAISVPIVARDERPFIQALIDGHTATLIVDTGAVTTTMDNGLFEGSSAGSVSLQIGELRFPRLKVSRADVRAYAEHHLGAPADGIVGRDLFSRYPVELDFPNHTMTIFRDSRSAAGVQPQGAAILPLRVIDGLPAVSASLDGQPPLWFTFGTGAGAQVQLEPSAARASRLGHAEHSLPFQEPAPTGSIGGLLVRARSLNVGSLDFNQPLVVLLDARGGGPRELAGTFGAMMLSRLNLFIDELSSSAFIVAPPGSTAARLYDPSGIALELRGDTIVVRSVIPGTPADVANVHPGDQILSINGLVPATLDFARQLVDGSPGTRVQIVYRRWHLKHSATLTLRVII